MERNNTPMLFRRLYCYYIFAPSNELKFGSNDRMNRAKYWNILWMNVIKSNKFHISSCVFGNIEDCYIYSVHLLTIFITNCIEEWPNVVFIYSVFSHIIYSQTFYLPRTNLPLPYWTMTTQIIRLTKSFQELFSA